MGIKIKIGEKPKPKTKVDLEIRKSVDGNLMIFDHEDIDIVLLNEKNKVLTYAKEIMDDKVYNSQDRLMKYLTKKGIIDPSTIRAGNIYSSIEAKLLTPKNDMNHIDFALLNIGRWMEEERPYFMYMKAVEKQEVEQLTNPDDEDSTELGEIPHAKRKGVLNPDVYPLGASKPYLAERKK